MIFIWLQCVVTCKYWSQRFKQNVFVKVSNVRVYYVPNDMVTTVFTDPYILPCTHKINLILKLLYANKFIV